MSHHYADIRTSKALQSLVRALWLTYQTDSWLSTLELMKATFSHGGPGVVAIGSRVSELRKNGFVIETRQISRVWHYRLVRVPDEFVCLGMFCVPMEAAA